VLGRSPSAKAAATDLVFAANEGGGRDNVTVVVARFGPPDASGDSTAHAAAVASKPAVSAGDTTVRVPAAGKEAPLG
jgi:serine/threonine protein phosphatase PrpC